MLKRIIFAITVSMILVLPASLLGDDLSFGNKAPQFSATMFRGEPLKGILDGKIYVVEFGGTACVPCIKFIPKMNKLQQQYPDVIFVSVFCESLDTVKPFMDGVGKEMQVRVATDDSGRMQKEWLDAAGLQGVPQAFIIDRSGCIAWFGYPDDGVFAETLEKVVDGSYDGRLEQMRIELTRMREEDERKTHQWIEKVNEVSRKAYACETPEESVTFLDQTLPEFAGSPERINLSIMKLSYYEKIPQSRERAYKHALSLAFEAVNERNPNHFVSACEAMLRHSEFALPENRDSRLIDLALAVLLDETAPTNHIKLHSSQATQYRVNRLVVIANARRLRGEWKDARMQLNAANTIMKNVKLENKPDWWLDEHKRLLLDLESKAVEWKRRSIAQPLQPAK